MTQDNGTQNTDEKALNENSLGLTRDEDDELRRLGYLAKFGLLTGELEERVGELRLKDRRETIREPRSFEGEAVPDNVLRMIPPHERPGETGSPNN